LAEEVRRSALLRCRVVTVIPNGVDVGVFQPRDRLAARRRFGIPREARTVLFVADSAAEKRKGLTTLLEALKGISKDGDLLFIALGSGLTGERLGDQFKTMEPIHDESDLSFLYSAADVFVLPSLQDNLPNTAIEALACGIPTIGSNVGGIVIRAGRTGLVFAPGDSDALKQALVALLGEPQRRAWMAEESRRIAEEEYSSEVQARRYVDLYESMIGASPSSATR
jgi:glycosyltransferase involved in cell wall biosynthesis